MLGDAQSAWKEIEGMCDPSRHTPEVLEMEWSAHAMAKNWKDALRAAQRLIRLDPGVPSGWIHRSYALRRLPEKGLPHARQALLPAVERFPKEYVIPYNLACYAAQMGQLDEAWSWLQRAVQSAGGVEKVRRMAKADEDLEELWPRLGKLTGPAGA
jgi:Flp pilus assembly protein TadD